MSMSRSIIAVPGEALKYRMVGRVKCEHVLSDRKTPMTLGFTESAITISAVGSITCMTTFQHSIHLWVL